jgi:hypothetical protein
MDVRSATALLNGPTRSGDTARTPPAVRTADVQKPAVSGRSMDDARAAARAAFAKVVAQPARIDTAQRLADARQANPEKPLPRGSLINVVV